MANKKKAELKTAMWEKDVQEFETDRKNSLEQIHNWRGYYTGLKETKEIINTLFQTIKDAVQWEQTDPKERDEKNKPAFEMSPDEAGKAAELIRPAQIILNKRMAKAEQEVEQFRGQVAYIDVKIARLKELIKAESSKDFDDIDDFEKEMQEEQAQADREVAELEKKKKSRKKSASNKKRQSNSRPGNK